MKKKLFILAVLLCSCFALNAQKTPNLDFDFSAVCSTGQTLYYRIIDAEQNFVSIVAPNGDNVNGWNGYNKPAGDITLPETVEYDGTSYTVRAIGDQSFNSCFGLTGSLVIPNSVTSIGNDAFFRCSGFSSLTIGNSVTSIGADAFWECSGLTGSLTIPNSVESIGEYAFTDLGYDGTLTIGSSVTSIGVRAFAYSKFAHIIAKPTTPPTLGTDVFEGVTGLLSITVPCGKDDDYKTATGWSSFASMIEEGFVYDLTVASANTDFGSASITQQATCENPQATVSATRNTGYKFIYWTENGEVVSYNNPYTFTLTTDRNLVANFFRQYDFSATCTTGQTLYYRIIDAEKHWVSIVAPNNDTWDYGWNGFTKPEGNITLPETVTHNDISYTVKEIGICAFSLCDGLTGSLSIPNSVTSIGEQAFNHCSGFTGSLTIPNSVTSIGMAAFWNCYGFTGTLTIPNSVTSIGDYAFYECSGFTGSLIIGNSVTNIGENAFESCSNFTGSLNIPNSVTSIGGSAFYGCSGFTGSLIIPNSVASIGRRAFYGCSGFTGSLTIPNSVTSIEVSAFERCSGFTGSLTIGSSVTSIGDNAFISCSRFTNIIAKPATPPTLGNNAFLNMSNLQTITVPCGNYDDYYYLATCWISFGDIMVEGFVYDLTVASANTDFGSASITQQPDCSTQAKVTATPNDGYKFVNWTENGEVVSYNNPYTFTLTTDRNLVANFSKQYDFSAACTTGQTLYYRIIDAEKHWVSIVAPNNDTWDYGWNGFTKPEGNITLPETVTHNDISYTVKEIGNFAFSNCIDLTGSLSIPNSVTSIGEQAFYRCSGFTGSLTIPNSVTSIGMGAFNNCSGFTGSLIIGNSVTSIGLSAFQMCSGFTGSLIIGNSVTNIGEKAFELCSNFTGSLNIPNSVTSIGRRAFYGCSGFTGSLIIPNSVAIIGGYAFSDCKGFTGSLTIGSSVTSIGESAFSLCSGFTNIIAKPATPPTLGNNAFLDMSNLQTITVPCGYYLGYYLATWWFSFGDIMVEGFVYDLTVASANNGFGSASITQQPDCSKSAKVTATPNDGCKFVNWTENGEVVSTDNPYTFGMATDRNLVANFATIGYHFNGTTGSEWNTAANWEENEVPAPNSPIVFINANCQVNTDAEVGAVTVAADKTLTIAEDYTLTADLITLEDGAQLVNNGTIICDDLTVKKDIEGYGTGTGGWYLVSSPVATTSLPVGMITDPAENYDLYRFSQTGDSQGREWLNYKAESFGIENQNGYLYASKNGTTILFRGGFASANVKPLAYDENAEFAGFNLVGNPYPCNATISGTNLRSSNYFYMMNANGTDLEVVANPVLAPCTGVFAVAANSDATVTFTQASGAANVTRGEKSSLQDIRVELLADGKVIDRAYLNMNGESLPKFRLQDNISEICFYQNKEELAVASTDATRGEMPLNFKAAKNGSYTITVNVENADMNYLHLVDNLTGNDVDLMGSEGDVVRNVSTYTFDAKTDDYASRFKLVFGVKDETSEASENFAFISNGEIIVSNEGRATLQVIDVLGRIVSSEEINGECRISTNGMTAGVYILNLNGKTQKIVVE